MKTEEALRDFCTKLLTEKQDKLESLREKAGHKYYRTIYIAAAIFMAGGLILARLGGISLPAMLTVILGPIIFGLLIFYIMSIREEYKVAYKADIINEIVKFYNKNLSYYPEKGILWQAVEVSNLFMSEYNFESS